MAETTFSFKRLGCMKKLDGTIDRYTLEVIDTCDGMTEEISVEAKHFASAQNMKRILLGRKILYSVTQCEHEKMLDELFAM